MFMQFTLDSVEQFKNSLRANNRGKEVYQTEVFCLKTTDKFYL